MTRIQPLCRPLSDDKGPQITFQAKKYSIVKIQHSLSQAVSIENIAMDPYVCSKFEIPDTLYRVDYSTSRTAFSSTEGFSAADTTKIYAANEMTEFKQAIVNQFTWSCRADLPFISLFSDREHAENWGRLEPWRGHQSPKGDWSLCVIDRTVLKGTGRFFKLNDLIEELSLTIPNPAVQHIRGAFLCLHRIPAEAIVETRNPEEVEKGKSQIQCTRAHF